MYQFIQILKMDLKNLFYNPIWLFYTFGFSSLLIIIFGFLTSGSYQGNVTSYDYYGITLMIYSALNAATLAANSFMEKDIKGPNMRIIYAPVNVFSIHFSKVIATVIYTTTCYTSVCLLLHLLFRINYGGTAFPLLWLLMVVLEFFSASLSVLMCCLLKAEESVNQIVSLAVTLSAFLGGLFFPVNGLGRVIVRISDVCPVKWVLAAAFQIIHDHNFSLFLPACFLMLGLSALFILGSIKFFKTEDYV